MTMKQTGIGDVFKLYSLRAVRTRRHTNKHTQAHTYSHLRTMSNKETSAQTNTLTVTEVCYPADVNICSEINKK